MTAVTIQRQLRRVVWLGENTLVCARPVTNVLFGLFRADNPAASQPFEMEGEADEPVLTVGASDAEEFVRWINAKLADSSAYRLPTLAEAADPAMLPLLGRGRGMWTLSTDSSGNRASLWLPEDIPGPWTVSGARIHERLRADQDASRVRPAPAASYARLLDEVTPRALRDSAEPAGVPPSRVEYDRPALGQAQSLVNAVHEALRQDLAALREQLDSRTGQAGPPVSSPTSGRLFYGTDETVRDALTIVDKELGRGAPQRSTTDPVGAVFRLGRGLARVADLVVARARADAALDVRPPHRDHNPVRRAAISYLRRPVGHDQDVQRVLEIVESVPRVDFDPLDLLLPLVAVLRKGGATDAVQSSAIGRPMRTDAETGVLLRATGLCGFAHLLMGHIAPPERGISDSTQDVRTVSPEMFVGSLERLSALAALRLTAFTRRETVVWGAALNSSLGGASSRQVEVPWAARCAHVVAEELRDLWSAPAGGDIADTVPAAALRLGALALAAAADQVEGGSEMAEQCRTVAAGVTVLQDRVEGVLPPCEAVMLVRN